MRTALASAGARMSSGREQRFFRHSLLVIEIGVALVLLACAGLLVRSFMHVMSYDSGFDASNTLTGTTSLYAGVITLKGPSTAWSKERYLNFTDQLLLRLKALPGVKFSALGSARCRSIQAARLRSCMKEYPILQEDSSRSRS